MGFNIGRFIGSIAPAIGGAFFGPTGAAVGLGVSAALAPDPAASNAATVGRATQVGPVSSTVAGITRQFTGGPGFASSVAPSPIALRGTGRIGQGLGFAEGITNFFGGGNGNGNPISTILAKARAATGGAVTRNKIIDAAKVCGLETAAQTFGLEIREVCLVVVKGRTRRRRGVSAADIRRTKRTIAFSSKIRKDLKALAR